MKINPRLITALGGGVAGLTAAGLLLTSVPGHEGKRNDPYLDVVKVRTVCYGHTANVQNRRYSDAECLHLLETDLIRHAEPVLKCTPQIRDKPHMTAAAVSLAFNIGTNAYCGSTVARRFKAGDFKGGCSAFDRWVYAKGKKYPGLVKRRADERALCERDT